MRRGGNRRFHSSQSTDCCRELGRLLFVDPVEDEFGFLAGDDHAGIAQDGKLLRQRRLPDRRFFVDLSDIALHAG